MILPPNDSTLVARNGHFRITSLVAEEFPWHRLGPADVRRQTQAMRSTWPQCRQHVLRRAFRVPHFEQVRYMARAKAWVKAALTPRMTISKAIWRNVSRMRARLRVNSSTASDGRGRMNEEEWGHPPGGPIKRGDKYFAHRSSSVYQGMASEVAEKVLWRPSPGWRTPGRFSPGVRLSPVAYIAKSAMYAPPIG